MVYAFAALSTIPQAMSNGACWPRAPARWTVSGADVQLLQVVLWTMRPHANKRPVAVSQADPAADAQASDTLPNPRYGLLRHLGRGRRSRSAEKNAAMWQPSLTQSTCSLNGSIPDHLPSCESPGSMSKPTDLHQACGVSIASSSLMTVSSMRRTIAASNSSVRSSSWVPLFR